MSTFCGEQGRPGRQPIDHPGTVSARNEGKGPHLRGNEDADERARLEVPHFEMAVLAASVDGLAAHNDGDHRARAALERVQQYRCRVRRCELPELR